MFFSTKLSIINIQEIFDEPDSFRLLASSLCKNIVGHDVVKAGIFLSLLGGVETMDDNGLEAIRSNINVLLVGVSFCLSLSST